MQKETLFKTKVLPLIKKLPKTWLLKTQEVARSGVPDILACINGKFVAIELKTNEGVVSKLQEYNLTRIQESGGISLIMTPSNFEEAMEYLENLTKEGKNGQYRSIKKGSKRDKTKLQNA